MGCLPDTSPAPWPRPQAQAASPHHLHRTDVLLLLHVDVCQVKPDVADLCRRLSHLGEDVPGLTEIALVSQDCTCRQVNEGGGNDLGSD